MRYDYFRNRDECDWSLRASHHRRQSRERRRQIRKRIRLALAVPFIAGLFVAAYCVVNGDQTGSLAFIAVGLMAPLVGTFDLLGEARP